MRNARISEFLGDDMQDFRLGFGQLVELQEKTGVGPYALYKRLMSDDWLIADIYETCRIGLIGAGMTPRDAFAMTNRYIKEQPPLENLNLARVVIIAGLHGAPEEDAGSTKEKDEGDGDAPLKTRDFYGMGAVMGFTPKQVDEMSLHQLRAAFDGYTESKRAESGGMSEDDKDDLFDMVLEEQRKIDGVE